MEGEVRIITRSVVLVYVREGRCFIEMFYDSHVCFINRFAEIGKRVWKTCTFFRMLQLFLKMAFAFGLKAPNCLVKKIQFILYQRTVKPL